MGFNVIQGTVVVEDVSGNQVEIDTNRLKIALVGDSGFVANVTSAGELLTKPSNAAPPSTTLVGSSVRTSISATSTTTFVIPNSETLVLLGTASGSEGSKSGNDIRKSRVSLYYSATGVIDGGEVILSTAYLAASNFSRSFQDIEFTGDGTAAIILERERLDSGSDEVFAEWNGYY